MKKLLCRAARKKARGSASVGETMPLTKKGKKIKRAMAKTYGKKKGEQVFYASQNKGTIKGTHKKRKKR